MPPKVDPPVRPPGPPWLARVLGPRNHGHRVNPDLAQVLEWYEIIVDLEYKYNLPKSVGANIFTFVRDR
jgi:hypothetical protein